MSVVVSKQQQQQAHEEEDNNNRIRKNQEMAQHDWMTLVPAHLKLKVLEEMRHSERCLGPDGLDEMPAYDPATDCTFIGRLFLGWREEHRMM